MVYLKKITISEKRNYHCLIRTSQFPGVRRCFKFRLPLTLSCNIVWYRTVFSFSNENALRNTSVLDIDLKFLYLSFEFQIYQKGLVNPGKDNW
jgi:hypothetical protein